MIKALSCVTVSRDTISFNAAHYFSEICAVSKVSKKEIGRVFKLILKTLETNVELITTGDFMVCKTSHIALIR